MSESNDIPPGLRTDAPPEDGSQILAWAIIDRPHWATDESTEGKPMWVLTKFVAGYGWKWCTAVGYCVSVKILAWMPLPAVEG